MFESEKALIQIEGIQIEVADFPYKYFDNYILICNPSINTNAELVERLEYLKSKVSLHIYNLALLHGALINLMRDYHYAFLVAMINSKELCDWIIGVNVEFEQYHAEIERITGYKFK